MIYLLHFIVIIIIFSFSFFGFGTLLHDYPIPNLLLLYSMVLSIQQSDGWWFPVALSAFFWDFSVQAAPGVYLFGFLFMSMGIKLFFQKFMFALHPTRFLTLATVVVSVLMFFWVRFYDGLFIHLGVAYPWTTVDMKTHSLWWQICWSLVFLYPLYLLSEFVDSLIYRLNQKKFII